MVIIFENPIFEGWEVSCDSLLSPGIRNLNCVLVDEPQQNDVLVSNILLMHLKSGEFLDMEEFEALLGSISLPQCTPLVLKESLYVHTGYQIIPASRDTGSGGGVALYILSNTFRTPYTCTLPLRAFPPYKKTPISLDSDCSITSPMKVWLASVVHRNFLHAVMIVRTTDFTALETLHVATVADFPNGPLVLFLTSDSSGDPSMEIWFDIMILSKLYWYFEFLRHKYVSLSYYWASGQITSFIFFLSFYHILTELNLY